MLNRLLGAATLLMVTAAPLCAQEPPPIPSIVTTGEATVRRAPDVAFITVAVETRAKNPRDAQRANAEAMTGVQQRLTAANVARDAIRTTGYNIQQEFDFANGRRVPREYVARNGVEIRLEAIDRVGEVLDLAVQAGATSVSGVRFDLKDKSGAEREALRMAVADARARADALAAGAGRAVDRILRIDDGPRQYKSPFPQPVMRMSVAGAEPPPTPVESGMIEVEARVTLTVAIK